MLNKSFELCLKTYGEKHMLMLRLYLNIGILYEDNRDFQKAYDYFVKWHETCQEVMYLLLLLLLFTHWSSHGGGWDEGTSSLTPERKTKPNFSLKQKLWHELIQLVMVCRPAEFEATALEHKIGWQFKEALSVLMLCAPVFIFISGSSALLGCPHCGLSIWLSLLPYSMHFSEFMLIFLNQQVIKL